MPLTRIILAALVALVVSGPTLAAGLEIHASISVHDEVEGKLDKSRITIYNFFYLDEPGRNSPFCSIETLVLVNPECDGEVEGVSLGLSNEESDDENVSLNCQVSNIDNKTIELTVIQDWEKNGVVTHKLLVGKAGAPNPPNLPIYFNRLRDYSGVFLWSSLKLDKIVTTTFVPIIADTINSFGDTDKLHEVNCPIRIPALLREE